MIQPFIAAITDATALIAEKNLFRRFPHMAYPAFAWWLFVCVALIGLVFSPWFVQIDALALSPHYLWLLLALAFLAANYNLLLLFSIQREQIANIEPFILFNPIVTILIAGVFYADERFWQIYVAAIVAAVMLVWSRMHKHHLAVGLPMLAVLGFSLLYGLEAIIIKQLLAVYSPLGLYLVRAVIGALFLWVIQKGRIPPPSRQQLPHIIFIAGAAILTSTLIYYAYSLQGIGPTIFALTLSPVLVYIFSVTFLKEPLRWQNLVASGVMIGLVIWVTLAR